MCDACAPQEHLSVASFTFHAQINHQSLERPTYQIIYHSRTRLRQTTPNRGYYNYFYSSPDQPREERDN